MCKHQLTFQPETGKQLESLVEFLDGESQAITEHKSEISKVVQKCTERILRRFEASAITIQHVQILYLIEIRRTAAEHVKLVPWLFSTPAFTKSTRVFSSPARTKV